MYTDAQPTPSEMETFLEVEAVLKQGQEMLKEISQYRGASKEIREVLVIHYKKNLMAFCHEINKVQIFIMA